MSELSDKEILELYDILTKFIRNLETNKVSEDD